MSDPAPPVDPALVEHAVHIARDAGELTLHWFRRAGLAVEHKGDGSPVTEADLAAETFMRAELAAAYPDDAVIGEEHADAEGTSGRTWVIDPIDGTKAFTKSVPLYSNLLALVDEHGPAVGVINLPALGETVWAGRGLGAFHNGDRCRVSDHASLDGAYVCTSEFGYWPPADLAAVHAAPVQFRTWGDAYGYSLVATGRAEAMGCRPDCRHHRRGGWKLHRLHRRGRSQRMASRLRGRVQRPYPRRRAVHLELKAPDAAPSGPDRECPGSR